MILTDLAEVLYAPTRAFKKIIANPKYLGAILTIVLFLAFAVGYEYSQFSKTYTEQTYPTIDQLHTFNNATNWQTSSNAALTNNFGDFYNLSMYVAGFGLPPSNPAAYYRAFGNNSMEINANNTNSIIAAIDEPFNIDCTQNGFQNLTLILKQLSPQSAPQNATVTLYSLSDTSYYQYDLTPQLSSAANLGEWNTFVLSLGPANEDLWTVNSSPQWNNITALTLNFNYASNQDVTIRIGAIYFNGQYLTPIQYNSTGILLQFLQLFSLQFIFTWFILTGLIYLINKILKGDLKWKPLFAALGFAMFVMVIREAINLVATFTLPAMYYSFDVSLGVRFDPYVALYYPTEAAATLSAQSQAALATIQASTQIFSGIVTAMAVASYVWLGALAGLALKSIKPEYSTVKCIAISAVALAATLLLLVFLVGAI